MRMLVTGAAGFVGAALTRRLVESGAEVTAFVRPGGDHTRLAGLERRLALVEVDFSDPAGAAAAAADVAPDVCFHLAAAGAVVRDGDRERVVRVNALAPFELACALAAGGCGRLVTAGSSSEYGPVAGPMAEDAAPAPDDVYGAAKLAGGALAHAVGLESGLEVVHLRLFSVYGPGEDERRLVPQVVRAVCERRPLDLTPGLQARDFVHVDDVVEALLAAASSPDAAGGTFNVGTGLETTVRDLGLLAAELAGADPALLRFGAVRYRPGERFAWRAATERAAATLGWRARTPLAQGLAALIDAHAGRRAA